jgi:Xaa-Pro aminopeptidase
MPPASHADRRERLRRLVRKTGADGLLVTHPANVTYLTGFTGDSSYLLLTPRDAVMVSDGRYTQQLAEECPELDTEIRPPGVEILPTVVRAVRAVKIGRLGIEAAAMTVDFWTELAKQLPQLAIEATTSLVEQLREVKDRDEIAQIRDAIELAERAFAVVRAGLRPECSEQQIAADLEYQIRLFGGRECSFTPIVGVGPRGALPHARLSGHQVRESDFVLIDWGARGELYVSDLTRVVVTGRISPKLERVYGVVLRAQQAAIDAIRPGAILQDIDAVARQVIQDAGYGKHFTHGLGHGIGLEIHEGPRFAPHQERPLKAGMVVTVEPGIYLPQWGGIRIEDDVLVTRTGCEVLSQVPKQLGDCVLR